MNNPVSISFLITAPDYVDFKTAAANAYMKKWEINLLRAVGAAMILTSLILCKVYGGTLPQILIYSALALVGILVGAFYEILTIVFVRRRALNYFESVKERFTAQNTEFQEDTVLIKTDRYSAAIPYELFWKAYEDSKVFLLYTGIDEMRFIPKRAMTEEECKQVQTVLKTKLKEKYQQEGAR